MVTTYGWDSESRQTTVTGGQGFPGVKVIFPLDELRKLAEARDEAEIELHVSLCCRRWYELLVATKNNNAH